MRMSTGDDDQADQQHELIHIYKHSSWVTLPMPCLLSNCFQLFLLVNASTRLLLGRQPRIQGLGGCDDVGYCAAPLSPQNGGTVLFYCVRGTEQSYSREAYMCHMLYGIAGDGHNAFKVCYCFVKPQIWLQLKFKKVESTFILIGHVSLCVIDLVLECGRVLHFC